MIGMRRVEIHRGDVRLSCLDGGSGRDVVVLLHGLAGSGGRRPRRRRRLPGIEAVAERPRWEQWSRVRAPTLLLRGQNGTTTAAEVSRMVELRPDVEHVVIPDAGHDAHLERPEQWARVLRRFLGRCQNSGERPW
jgi:pimeloyl-ACP methyl ester carboxylesterase